MSAFVTISFVFWLRLKQSACMPAAYGDRSFLNSSNPVNTTKLLLICTDQLKTNANCVWEQFHYLSLLLKLISYDFLRYRYDLIMFYKILNLMTDLSCGTSLYDLPSTTMQRFTLKTSFSRIEEFRVHKINKKKSPIPDSLIKWKRMLEYHLHNT